MKWSAEKKERKPQPEKGSEQGCATGFIRAPSLNHRSQLQWRLAGNWLEEPGGFQTRRWIAGCVIRPAGLVRPDIEGPGWWVRAWSAAGDPLLENHRIDNPLDAIRLADEVLLAYVSRASM